MRKLPRVLILWGVPGVGKTTFADWLVENKGFIRIDSDLGGAGSSKAAKAWSAFLKRSETPEALAFMKVARYSQQPIVLEFGMYATVGAIALLEQLRQAGAEVWWFDGDRDEAFEAWKLENRKSGRTFDFGERKWSQVVAFVNENWPHLAEFFGSNIVRTIEAGPVHVLPAVTFAAMLGDKTASSTTE
jgi:hypothetical protein